ncbi:MAG TPA: tetratricopeptide repeat protein [Sphingomicrobium sp.]|nr:tetratricopeptide repeat protein [Sphingomicrobium sp.]
MALTPDTGETFLREVDENLRRDQMSDFAKRYGGWIIAGVVLFLAAIGGWLYWQDRQVKQAQQESETLAAIYADIAAQNVGNVPQRLKPLEESSNAIVSATARLAQAAVALERNDRPAALAKYRDVAADDGLPPAYRDLATIRATALEFDSLKPEQVIERLAPLTKAGEPWFGSAGELTAMAYLKQGQKAKAGKLFADIAADSQVPPTIRTRAVQLAGTLGVDATASLPTLNQ